MMMAAKENWVISGIGLVTPLGNTREKTWARLLNGESGIRKSGRSLSAPVLDFTLNGARSRAGDFALTASEEAMLDANLTEQEIKSRVIGCAVSLSKPLLSEEKEPLCSLPEALQADMNLQSDEIKPKAVLDPSLLLGSFSGFCPSDLIYRRFGLKGPRGNFVGACATGLVSLSMGLLWLRSGDCDGVLVGATESSLTAFYEAGFKKMGVLSEGPDPFHVRPFDRDRDGFAMGEGAGVLFLEKESAAKARAVQPYARIKKVFLTQSASDPIRFGEKGEEMTSLLNRFGAGDAFQYVNAHGTGTRRNDALEIQSLNSFFENKPAVSVSSTKGATGHLLGAAGAVEAAFCALALRDQTVPPNCHLKNVDPAVHFDAPQKAVSKELTQTLSLSYGFGGQMAALGLEKI